jgi:hypothetical protein
LPIPAAQLERSTIYSSSHLEPRLRARAHYSFLGDEVVVASDCNSSCCWLLAQHRSGHTIKASKSPFPVLTLKIRLVLIIAPNGPGWQRPPLRQQPIQS